jgi:hypothetical protein
MFKKGDRVICIEGTKPNNNSSFIFETGKEYIISEQIEYWVGVEEAYLKQRDQVYISEDRFTLSRKEKLKRILK